MDITPQQKGTPIVSSLLQYWHTYVTSIPCLVERVRCSLPLQYCILTSCNEMILILQRKLLISANEIWESIQLGKLSASVLQLFFFSVSRQCSLTMIPFFKFNLTLSLFLTHNPQRGQCLGFIFYNELLNIFFRTQVITRMLHPSRQSRCCCEGLQEANTTYARSNEGSQSQ